jgi:hypothetical protein
MQSSVTRAPGDGWRSAVSDVRCRLLYTSAFIAGNLH